MSTALPIPQEDLARFGLLKYAVREEIRAWLAALEEFEAAADKAAAVATLSLRYAGRIKISKGTLYRKRKAYLERGWDGLVNKAKIRTVRNPLPAAFVSFWQGLCMDSQRKVSAAYRSLFNDHLLAGRVIPGYGDWRRIWGAEHPDWTAPEVCPYRAYDNVPEGWTYRTLLRYAPSAVDLAATRIGLGHASKFLPKVPTTRAGLHLGQFYVIDDVWHDLKVNFLGNRNAHRPLELGALELLSGHYCVWGLKPIIEREDGSKQMLPERYVRYLLAHILCRIGIHSEGCTFMGEHGTARIPDDLVEAINRWAGGRVSFEAGGIHGAPIAKGLYAGRPRGNSRFKAALESHHNLKHNELGLLPGQQGMDRAHAPEELYGREAENRALVKAVFALAEERPDIAEQLRMPFCSFAQFYEALTIVYDRIADRTHHDLEGFEEAGLVVQEFRLAQGLPWMPLAELNGFDAEQRAAIEAVIQRPGMAQLRPMSPRQAFNSRTNELVRLPDCALPDILGPELGDSPKVDKDLTLTVKDPDIPNRQHTFVARVRRPDGREESLKRGERYLVHVSPFGEDIAYVSDHTGQFLGTVDCLQKACRTDIEALQANFGKVRHATSEELKRLKPRGEQRLRERFEDTLHNVRVLTGTDPFEQEQLALTEADNARRRNEFIPEDLGNDGDEYEEEEFKEKTVLDAASLL